jgi:hypothetical protein
MGWVNGVLYPDAKPRCRDDNYRLDAIELVLRGLLDTVAGLRAKQGLARSNDIASEHVLAHGRKALGALLPEHAVPDQGGDQRPAHLFGVPWDLGACGPYALLQRGLKPRV